MTMIEHLRSWERRWPLAGQPYVIHETDTGRWLQWNGADWDEIGGPAPALPTDAEMRQLRDAGAFVCQCSTPGGPHGDECATCRRLVWIGGD